MHIIWILVIGLVVGALASLLLPGKDPGGIVITTLVGVAGSVLASLLGRAAGWYSATQAAGFVASVLGAMLLLAVYRVIARHLDRTMNAGT